MEQEQQPFFSDLGLGPKLLEALDIVGYKHPTPIQAEAIPIILMGRDVIGIAQTGTGKTASFTLPLLEILQNGKAKSRMPRALILAPTRELAAQILDNLNQYSQKIPLTAVLLVGGDSMGEQTTQLQKGVDVLIATPGRLMDHFKRGSLILTDTKFFIIDEADRMMDMGFIPDIEIIAGFLPKIRQTLMFTATMPLEIRKLAKKFLSNPKEISVARTSSTASTITQNIFHTTSTKKPADLLALLKELNPSSTLIFCNRKTDVDRVKAALVKNRIKAEAMHGDMAQSQRYASLDRFKSGESSIIVCSDIAARGIDIDNVSHVINYDVPRHAEDYVHRIGRTGRAGKSGLALTMVTPDEDKNLEAIIALIQQDIPVLAKPALREESKPREKAQQPAPAAVKNEERPARGKKSQLSAPPPPVQTRPQKTKPDENNDEIQLGFGDDIPAFMRNG